jgi:hypothetical protein
LVNLLLRKIFEFLFIYIGHGASGNAQVAHWDSMLNAQSETISRWHALLES